MRVFRIRLGDCEVGTLSEAGAGSIFTFDSGFRENAGRPTLSQSLSDAAGRPIDRAFDDGIVPFFENLLPENGPLRRYLASLGPADARDDYALLDLLGDNLPGAVSATLAYETDEARERRLRTPRSPASWRFSLAGVQMKFSGNEQEGRWSVATLDAPGDWIVKLPTPEFPGIVENEFAMMSLARDCGLDVPELALVELDAIDDLEDRFRMGRHAYAIRRFDRENGRRIHQEDFCQIFGLRPELKYTEDIPDATAERVASAVRDLCSSDDVREWISRLFFSFVIGNGDAHLKNHAVSYPDGRTAHLAPLYDVVCTLRFDHADRLALSIGGVSEFHRVDETTLADFARGAGISPRIVRRAAGSIGERMADAWPRLRGSIADEDVRAILDHRVGTVMPALLA